MPTPTRTIALAFTSEERHGYFCPHLRTWTITDTGKVEYPRYEYATSKGIFLTDFAISCQGHNQHHGGTSADHGRLYAFKHGYEVSMVELRDAATMARSLATLDRRLTKLDRARGSADTFPEYVTRIAECLGATEIIERRKGADLWSDRADTWRRMTLGDGRNHLAWVIDQWRARVLGAAVAS